MRKKFIYWLFEHSQRIYIKFKNKKPWEIKTQELLEYSNETFGYQLGEFLNKNRFELLPKVERHDAYHLLTGYGTKVEDEIALQCLCFGNGKRSLYLYGAMILGILILPDYYTYYYQSYRIGNRSNPFHQFNYKHLLHVNIDDFRDAIFSKAQRNSLIIN